MGGIHRFILIVEVSTEIPIKFMTEAIPYFLFEVSILLVAPIGDQVVIRMLTIVVLVEVGVRRAGLIPTGTSISITQCPVSRVVLGLLTAYEAKGSVTKVTVQAIAAVP